MSPAFQQAALDYYSLPVRYHVWPTPPDALESEVEKLRGEDYLGANVTIPHKERVIGLLDGLDPVAGRIGAVNTIVKEGGRLVGYNTDVNGFVRALSEVAGFEARGKSALVLGAGGAARAAAFGLAGEGVASLTIANRPFEQARSLARDLREERAGVRAARMTTAALVKPCANADLIVNCTPIGMLHGPAEGRSPLDAKLIRPGVLVYDIVYTPAETPLLRYAAEAGAFTLGGLPMLVFQGAASFELWTGKKAPVEVMFLAARGALAGQSAAGRVHAERYRAKRTGVPNRGA